MASKSGTKGIPVDKVDKKGIPKADRTKGIIFGANGYAVQLGDGLKFDELGRITLDTNN